MGPVWKLVKGVKDVCGQCGKEILDFPAVGRVVDFQFLPDQKLCWECYRYNANFLDEMEPESAHPYQPVSKPIVP